MNHDEIIKVHMKFGACTYLICPQRSCTLGPTPCADPCVGFLKCDRTLWRGAARASGEPERHTLAATDAEKMSEVHIIMRELHVHAHVHVQYRSRYRKIPWGLDCVTLKRLPNPLLLLLLLLF